MADFRLTDPASRIYYTLGAAAGDEISIDQGAQMTGSVHSNGRVVVKLDARVDGDISAVGDIDNRGTISGSSTPGAPTRALPLLLSESEARALADRIFEQETVFENETLDDVVFVAGKVRLLGAVNGTGTIIATGSIELEHRSGPDPLQAGTRLSLIAFQHVKIHPNRSFRGVAYASQHVMIENGVHFEGVAVAGQQIQIQKDAVVQFLNPDVEVPKVTILTPAEGVVVNTPTVRVLGTVSDDGVIASVTVNGTEVPFPGGQFQTDVTLAEGVNGIVVVVVDSTGKHGATSVGLVLDTHPPALALEAPAPGQLTNQPEIRVAGEAADERGITSLQVNGLPAAITGERFEALVPVAEGPNTIVVRAVDLAGNLGELNVEVVRFTLPIVTITSPEDLGTIAATTADVVGSVSDPAANVTVNGVPAVVSGASFVAEDIPLIEGGNILTATAISVAGRVGSDSINVVRDLTPPRVTIESPRDGASVFTSSVLVSGMVNDIVAGTVNASEAAVTVNGYPAAVANRSYLVEVPLTIAATTADVVGSVSDPAANVTVNGVPAVVSGASFVAEDIPLWLPARTSCK